MEGDFTRNTFDASNHFRRVLMQQGRVQLDADWNEQTAILLHYLQTLAADLIGPHGGPAKSDGTPGEGFKIDAIDNDLTIGMGHYYVDGILCENDLGDVRYSNQPYFPGAPALTSGLVYLDVWERHLTYVEQEDQDGEKISIREAALNGPDTATRAQVVWQVKVEADQTNCSKVTSVIEKRQPKNRGRLKARAKAPGATVDDNPCVTPPESRYRGAENQLYRVEIHRGGAAASDNTGATFKWSRENGSVIFPVRKITGDRVELETLGRDARLGLQEGDWVEIEDDIYALHNLSEPLLQVVTIDRDNNWIKLSGPPPQDVTKHRLLRRWEGVMEIKETGTDNPEDESNKEWINLEDGVQVQFMTDKSSYRTGDFWLIPARTVTGDVEWPRTKDAPKAREPHGVTHHYAPLAIVSVNGEGVKVDSHCRSAFTALLQPQGEP